MVLSDELIENEAAATRVPDALEQFRAQQRDQIGTALIRLVVDQGFSGANVSALTQRAGISRKTFYKYFPSIESALLYTRKLVLRELSAEELEVLPSNSGLDLFLHPLEKIRSFVATHQDHLRFLSFFDFALSAFGIVGEEVAEYEASMSELLRFPLDAFTAGQRDGTIRADLDPRETVLTCSTAVFGAAQRCVAIPGTQRDRKLADTIMRTEIDVWRTHLAGPNSSTNSRR